MANLMDLVKGQVSDTLIDQFSQQLGGASKQQTAAATSGAMSLIMSALAKNASTPEGASSLASALEKDHDGSVLDNIMDLIGGQVKPQQSRATNGLGILKHVLGGKQSGAVDMISKMSGMDTNETGRLMVMLAPVIMGALGKAKQEKNLDAGGLAGLLSKSVGSAAKQNDEMGFIGKFLDQDGDGSYMDDVAGMGMNMLGKFFNRK